MELIPARNTLCIVSIIRYSVSKENLERTSLYVCTLYTLFNLSEFLFSVGFSKSESEKLERYTYSITCHRNCVGIDCYISGKWIFEFSVDKLCKQRGIFKTGNENAVLENSTFFSVYVSHQANKIITGVEWWFE